MLVSIAALMCCMPQRAALTDERVQRMLLSLQGLSTPYLQTRFKSEAQQVANRKNFMAEQQVRQRPPRSRFPSPAIKVSEFLRGDAARTIGSDSSRRSRSRKKKFFELQRQAQTGWETECIVTKSLQAKLVLPAPRPGL